MKMGVVRQSGHGFKIFARTLRIFEQIEPPNENPGSTPPVIMHYKISKFPGLTSIEAERMVKII